MNSKFENEYMCKFWRLRTAQWNNYFEDENNDLNEIDREIYNIIMKYRGKIEPVDRRSTAACLLLNRELADKNKEVSELRNRIDDFDNYNADIHDEIRSDRYKYKLALSRKMKNDVVKLMKLRNSVASELGHKSYPELVFSYEELDKNKIIERLENYLEENLPKAKALIEKYDITWESWFKDLDRIGTSDKEYDARSLVDTLLDRLGYEEIKKNIKIDFKEKGYSGCAAEISPGDVRIVVEPINSLKGLRTLFHEVGHAIEYALNQEEGIFRVLPPSYDEAMAVVMEYMAPFVLKIDAADREKMMEIMTLEYTRCAISALFEFELWDKVDQAEELYLEYYGRLGMNIENPAIWSSDTFRSIDPVYIYSYVFGAILAEKIYGFLKAEKADDFKAWGDWLEENIYFDGCKRAFSEKIEDLI